MQFALLGSLDDVWVERHPRSAAKLRITVVAGPIELAYTLPNRSYATHRAVPAAHVVELPDDIPFEVAPAVMLKRLTAHYLIHHSYPVQRKETVLFHAAAGGVGLLAGQWLAAKGVRAIGTAAGPSKVALMGL